jgi:hypothetical protein
MVVHAAYGIWVVHTLCKFHMFVAFEICFAHLTECLPVVRGGANGNHAKR